MENPLQRVSRLIGAIESLGSEQAFLIETDDFAGAVAIVDRCQPLIDEVSALMQEASVARNLSPAVRKRAQDFFLRQQSMVETLAAKKAGVRQELDQIAAAQTKTHQLRGAYGARRPVQTSVLAGQA